MIWPYLGCQLDKLLASLAAFLKYITYVLIYMYLFDYVVCIFRK